MSLVEEYAAPRGLRVALASVTGFDVASGHEDIDRRSKYGHLKLIDYAIAEGHSSLYLENVVTLQGRLLFGIVSSRDAYWSERMALLEMRDWSDFFKHDEEVVEHTSVSPRSPSVCLAY